MFRGRRQAHDGESVTDLAVKLRQSREPNADVCNQDLRRRRESLDRLLLGCIDSVKVVQGEALPAENTIEETRACYTAAQFEDAPSTTRSYDVDSIEYGVSL